MAETELKIVQFGLGPIGIAASAEILRREREGAGVRLVGAIDKADDKVGKDLSELVGLESSSGIRITDDVEGLLAETQPDVVVHCTTSFIDRVRDQLEVCIRGGANVISSTEELAYPFQRQPDLSASLDALCKEHGVTVVGAGINPGFVMDSLVAAATSPCTEVTSVESTRIVDAGGRRKPLQMKVGAGLSVEEFARRKATGTFGHIGLVESVHLVASALGWRIEEIRETLEPVISEIDVVTPFLEVKAGQVAGIDHRAKGIVGGNEAISLTLQMYVGAAQPVDRVRVEGTPPIMVEITGGVFGDTGTVGVLVNAIELVYRARPGLQCVTDLAVPRFTGAPGKLR